MFRPIKTLLSLQHHDPHKWDTKPFDLLVEGNESGNWLGRSDSNPDTVVQSLPKQLTRQNVFGVLRRFVNCLGLF